MAHGGAAIDVDFILEVRNLRTYLNVGWDLNKMQPNATIT